MKSKKNKTTHTKAKNLTDSSESASPKNKLKHRKKASVTLFFNHFAKKTADFVGNAFTFMVALIIVGLWAISGHYFHYSDTWQLVINTGTTIITFLIVFLIQNTQNRDTEILNLKLDELIKGVKGASNSIIDLNDLSDTELKELEKAYTRLKSKTTGE